MSRIHPPVFKDLYSYQQSDRSHLGLEALHQDGHQQIEEHVVAERHEGNEVERRPGGGGGHAVVQHHVPVLLRQNLAGAEGTRESREEKRREEGGETDSQK